MGGMGKTQLAKHYANLNKHKYDLIWWFDSEHNLTSQYKNLAIQLNEHPKLLNKEEINLNASDHYIIEHVRNILRTKNINWLLIFDNAKDEADIINYIPEKHNQTLGHILITSRNSLSWRNILLLKEFNYEESIKLLQKLTNSSNPNFNVVADKIGNYPLAIPLLASYMKINPNVNNQILEQLFKISRNNQDSSYPYIIYNFVNKVVTYFLEDNYYLYNSFIYKDKLGDISTFQPQQDLLLTDGHGASHSTKDISPTISLDADQHLPTIAGLEPSYSTLN